MNKTVLITGTSSGIGKSAAKRFQAEGWNVIATMRNPVPEQELTSSGNLLLTALDVEKPDTISQAVAAGVEKFGGIDVLVNNAGQGLFGVFEATPEDKIRHLFEVNLFGMMRTTRAVLPYLREQQRGVIVNLSSSTGRFSVPLLSVYAATKYALEGFSEALSFELSYHHIRVKLIEPGVVETNFDNASRDNYAADPSLTAYDDYLQKMIKIYAESESEQPKSSADEVAAVIYQAATDQSDTLRYPVGKDMEAMNKARESMSDQQYLEMMRGQFAW